MTSTAVAVDGEEIEIPTCLIENVSFMTKFMKASALQLEEALELYLFCRRNCFRRY